MGAAPRPASGLPRTLRSCEHGGFQARVTVPHVRTPNWAATEAAPLSAPQGPRARRGRLEAAEEAAPSSPQRCGP